MSRNRTCSRCRKIAKHRAQHKISRVILSLCDEHVRSYGSSYVVTEILNEPRRP